MTSFPRVLRLRQNFPVTPPVDIAATIEAEFPKLRAQIKPGARIAVGVGISAAFTNNIIKFLAVPIGGLQSLQIIEVTESIGVFMTVALLAGVAISLPYVVFEFWMFAAPGLRPRERWYGLIGIPLAAVFFIGGMAFTYYVLLPSALPFLLNFEGFKAQIRPESYFSFVTGLLFWVGIAFEFPLVIYVLTAIGFVKPQVLAKQWRVAVVIILKSTGLP